VSILTEITGLQRMARSRGDNPTLILVPWQRVHALVMELRQERDRGALIVIGQERKRDIGVAQIAGMTVQISLGDELMVATQGAGPRTLAQLRNGG
jgi:hypothetical protein